MTNVAGEVERLAMLVAVGERMISLRTSLGVDIEDAARTANIAAERLAEAEAGETVLDDGEVRRLADCYGVEVTAFFGGRVTPFSYLAGA